MRKTKIVVPGITIPDTLAANAVVYSPIYDLPDGKTEVFLAYTAVASKLQAAGTLAVDSGYKKQMPAQAIATTTTAFTMSDGDAFSITFSGTGWKSYNIVGRYPLVEVGAITVTLPTGFAAAATTLPTLVSQLNLLFNATPAVTLANRTNTSGELLNLPLSTWIRATSASDRLIIETVNKGEGCDFKLADVTGTPVSADWLLPVTKVLGSDYLWQTKIKSQAVATTDTAQSLSVVPADGLADVVRVWFKNGGTIALTGQNGKVNIGIYNADSEPDAVKKTNKEFTNVLRNVVLGATDSAYSDAVNVGEYNSKVTGVVRYTIVTASTEVTGTVTAKLQTAFGTSTQYTIPIGGNLTYSFDRATLLEPPAALDWVDASSASSAFTITPAGNYEVQIPITTKVGPWVRLVVTTAAVSTVIFEAQMSGDIIAQ
jgi:hypothetical protein